jgi:hypothetical protein
MLSRSAIAFPVYFPFSFISPSLVEAMSLCFNRVVVYQPASSKPQKDLLPWVERGFLDVRSPFENVIDKKSLEAALRSLRSWGLMHQHADMAYLKTVGNSIAPVDPETARIVADIRATGVKNSKKSEERELSLQVFLHLAQEFDQHSWELRQQLHRFNDQYQALQSLFRQDQPEQSNDLMPKDLPAFASQWQAGLFHVTEEDSGNFAIQKRMAAWNHLFQKDPVGSSLLFTDSRSALAYLLDGVQEKVEALNFNIAYTQVESGEAAKNHSSWADHLHEIFNMVLTTPWSHTLQERIVQANREIEKSMGHGQGLTMKSRDRSVSFRWYVVPHQVAASLLNQRCGLNSSNEDEGAGVNNTVVGLIECLGSVTYEKRWGISPCSPQ